MEFCWLGAVLAYCAVGPRQMGPYDLVWRSSGWPGQSPVILPEQLLGRWAVDQGRSQSPSPATA